MQNVQSLQSLSYIKKAASVTPPGPIPETGLFLWLKADAILGLSDTDPITTWADSSPEGNDADQATAANRPIYRTNIINSLPAVRFDNLNDGTDFVNRKFFNLPDAFSGFTEGEIFWVGVVDADPPANQYQNTFHKFGSYSADNNNEHYPFTSGDMYNGFGSTLRHNNYYDTAGTLDSWHILNVFSAANDWGVNIDSVNVFTTATNTVGFRADCMIGADDGTIESFGLAGYIAELIVYNRKVDTTERNSIYSYLATKYGL